MNTLAPAKWEEEPNDWQKLPPLGQAAHLYNRHHLGCPACVAAGIRGAPAKRCAEGQALWDAYQRQGTPPHFLWANPTPRPITQAPTAEEAADADQTI